MNTLPPPAPIFRPYCTPVALALAALRLGDENQARNPIGAGFDLAQTAFPFATEVEVPMAFEMFSVPLHLRAGRQVAGIRQFEIKHIEGAASEIAQFLVDYDQANSASDLEAKVGKTTKLWTVACDNRLLGSVVMPGDAPPPGFVLTPALALEALERSIYAGKTSRLEFKFNCEAEDPGNRRAGTHSSVDHHTYAALSVPLTVLARLRDFRFNAQDVLFSLLWSLQNHGRRVELEIGTVTMANHTVRVRGRNNTTTEVFAPVESAPLRIRLWYDNAATNTSTPSNSPAEVWTLGYHLCGKLRCKRVFQEGMCCEQHRPF
ncbi:hypothetical protein MKEN_00187700 [Mycena kentingensis (nom. inval.)]|nr:hypothetical protein MKEN_00187700 [Mycena kentingensis (nom. inval.)]